MNEGYATQGRHGLTAIARAKLSRPVTQAIEDSLIRPSTTVFDYGCGRGGDVARLNDLGIKAAGWDPVHRPASPCVPADVVNIGYVVNVIENPDVRAQALQAAWKLTHRLLIVSARLDWDVAPTATFHGDGVLTAKGTFQKFYRQEELRSWVEEVLLTHSVAASPGIIYVFKDKGLEQAYLLSRVRQRSRLGSRQNFLQREELLETNRNLLEPLAIFLECRGRLPEVEEIPDSAELVSRFGSIRSALAMAERIADATTWQQSRKSLGDDLLVYLALATFGGRPRYSELSLETQNDVKALFGSHKEACQKADGLLMALGDSERRSRACSERSTGKVTPDALYVHVTALPSLPPLLRVYEGCARALTGTITNATLVKLHRLTPKVSYLVYPCFDKEPHPALHVSIRANLKTLDVKYRDFRNFDNPPILHRKETFVTADYPGRATFERLTSQEERHGLLDNPAAIGTKLAWHARVKAAGWRISGHRLLRLKSISANEDFQTLTMN